MGVNEIAGYLSVTFGPGSRKDAASTPPRSRRRIVLQAPSPTTTRSIEGQLLRRRYAGQSGRFCWPEGASERISGRRTADRPWAVHYRARGSLVRRPKWPKSLPFSTYFVLGFCFSTQLVRMVLHFFLMSLFLLCIFFFFILYYQGSLLSGFFLCTCLFTSISSDFFFPSPKIYVLILETNFTLEF